MSPRIAVKSIELSERRVPFRHPFRFDLHDEGVDYGVHAVNYVAAVRRHRSPRSRLRRAYARPPGGLTSGRFARELHYVPPRDRLAEHGRRQRERCENNHAALLERACDSTPPGCAAMSLFFAIPYHE